MGISDKYGDNSLGIQGKICSFFSSWSQLKQRVQSSRLDLKTLIFQKLSGFIFLFLHDILACKQGKEAHKCIVKLACLFKSYKLVKLFLKLHD